MSHRIEITNTVPDSRVHAKTEHIKSHGFRGTISDLHISDLYTIDKTLSPSDRRQIAALLTDPITQSSSVDKPATQEPFSWCIEIGYLPGVTDNLASTAREIIQDALNCSFADTEGVYTSQVLYITGTLTEQDARSLAQELHNPLIQRARVLSYEEYSDRGWKGEVPRVRLKTKPTVDEVPLDGSDDQLQTIGTQGIENKDGSRRGPLALDIPYMHAIRDYFAKQGRNPTDVELESIAQTWSEHCKHTIFSDPIDEIKEGLYRHYIQRATQEIRAKKGDHDICVSVFKDNAGAIAFDDDFLVTHKVETHNSPSALDPFGGSLTGIVGVNRDVIGFGLGAQPIANLYGFCLADPAGTETLFRDRNMRQQMLSPRRIMDGVIAGVNEGGNCSGIPTSQGFLYFNERYKGKPLVFAGTIGLIPRTVGKKKAHEKKAQPGDLIVMIGGRVGKDGIHGATFSSVELDEGSPATAVQIGDPITQKKLSDALVKEARDAGLFTSITDNGAGGLSCSVSEMAKECGGCEVELEKVPLKYSGLAPWEIWISESQERMTLAVPQKKWKKLQALLNRRGVEATAIGTFTDSGRCVVRFNGETVMDVELEFLHNGLPAKQQRTKKIQNSHKEPRLREKNNLTEDILAMVSRRNCASHGFVSGQYDYTVQSRHVGEPVQGNGRVNADTTVIQPRYDKKKGVVLSQGLYPRYSDIDTYAMAAAAIDTAVRTLVCAGANPENIALLDNFCWCSSTEPERLWQLKEAARACYEYAVMYGTPYISGKDSMFNDFKGYNNQGDAVKISIPPTLLISGIGIIEDVRESVSLDAKSPGDLVYILGETHDELGGSEYYAYRGELEKGSAYTGKNVPQVEGKKNKQLYTSLAQAVRSGLISSAQSVGIAGSVVALVKTALGGMLGMDIDIAPMPGSWNLPHQALFSESQGRVIVTVAPKNKNQFESCLKGQPFAQIGTVTKEKTVGIRGPGGKQMAETDLEDLYSRYHRLNN